MPTEPLPSSPDLEFVDEEPLSTRRLPSWELLIGLLLVLGLAGAGLWQWWQSSNQFTQYRRGQQAEAAHDWDAALVAFHEAGDYQDARVHAANAAQFQKERDAAYATATAARTRQDWAAFLPAVEKLRQIAPTYRDTPALLATGQDAIYTPALSGTVVLRPNAQPPGWYTYRPDGWHWLDRTDPQSRLLTTCPNGEWVIDVPGDYPLNLTPTALPSESDATRRAQGRRLALLHSDGTLHRLLDPALSGWTLYNCDNRQVWGIRYDLAGSSFAYTATRQLFDAPRAAPPALPGPTWRVLALAPDGLHILVVDTINMQSLDPQIPVYDADADGRNLRPLGVVSDQTFFLSFSPDSRYALLLMNGVHLSGDANAPAPVMQQQLLALDPVDAKLLPLAEVRASTDDSSPGMALFGQFLQHPPYTGQVEIIRMEAEDWRIILIDPAHPTAAHSIVLPHPLYDIFSALSDAGELFVSGNPQRIDFSSGTTLAITPTIVYINAQNQVQEFHPPLAPNSMAIPSRVEDGRLVYWGTPLSYSEGDIVTDTVYSVPLATFGDPRVTPATVYTGTHKVAFGLEMPQLWYEGTGWLAYATPRGELRARRYDGTNDVHLDDGVTGFASPYALNRDPR